ncbi:hypothetical protein EV368DRAFT_89399 [Lentinula lateritia]|nr:hypothetical protein EV368DRAFT_89399 [Lentinula lateritia]
MSSLPSKAPSHAGPSHSSPPRLSSREEVAASLDSNGEVEQDQLTFTIESPSTPQLQLFENVFNTGKSLWVSWTIPEDTWRRYDELLHSSTSAMKVLVELNMLNEQDSCVIDRSKLQRFQQAQEQEALLVAKRKRVNVSPQPRVRSKKRRVTKTAKEPVSSKTAAEEVSRLVRPVIPPSRPAPLPSDSTPSGSQLLSSALPLVPARARDRSQMEVPTRPFGPSSSSIKASQEDPAVTKMSPAICPPLVPRVLSQHPYRVENERLAACVHWLESQLASSRQENATLTSALSELDQLQESMSAAAQQQKLHNRLLDQVQTLERALPRPPNESLVDRFRGLEEDLCLARESRAKYLSRFESSNRRNEELKKSLRKKIETLQEEVHRFPEQALFAEKMIREYPEEGSYSVSLPPLAEVQGELNETLASLHHVATFAHRLYRCDPSSILSQHNQYVGVIIDAVISFLRRGLDTSDQDVLALNFQLALQDMEAAHFIHAELHL